jgi:hypothetical protein
LILCPELVQDGNDRRQLQPMSRAVVKTASLIHRARCTRQCVDGQGCCLELELMIPAAGATERFDAPIRGCTQRACPCLTDWIGTLLFDNGYWSEANLNAPGPDRLIATGKKRNFPPPDQDPVPLPEHADAAARMMHRLATAEGSALYKRRAATVEPVNGHLKDRTSLRRFARRGLAACQAELDFAALVLNLRKLWRVTPDRRMAARLA